MRFELIETVTIQILQEVHGRFLFPYQIFNRIKQKNSVLGKQIETDYLTEADRPNMGQGAGVYYSAVSFVAHALSKFNDKYSQIQKECSDANGIEVEGITPGNKGGTSIWAWKEGK